jgi:hypothetical protein
MLLRPLSFQESAMTDLQQFIIDRLAEKILEHERRNSPRGLFWPDQHAAICKAAERVTRQQRRLAERQDGRRP